MFFVYKKQKNIDLIDYNPQLLRITMWTEENPDKDPKNSNYVELSYWNLYKH